MLPSRRGFREALFGRRGRRLAAIAFLDVVGYSRMMSEDERGTHARWQQVLGKVIAPQARLHGGTIVKSTGDGVLAEFPSALAAVEWAQAVQHAALAPEAGNPGPFAMRIAVHVGDVESMAGDIHGDGVNLAARLQEHAPPGGIALSEAVHDLLRGVLGGRVRDLGLLQLKGFERPVHAYALDFGEPAAAALTPARGGLPSIAVLPLWNLGGCPANEYFADGVVEDIITSLSGLRELMVISRASTLHYRGQQPDPREVGRSLGVRYVLTGSIRRLDGHVRVSVQLLDAQTGASLWGDRVEAAQGELFALQDRIVTQVVAGIAPNVRSSELQRAMRKRPESFTAYDHTLRGLDAMASLDRPVFLRAREHFDRAIVEDPNFAMPVALAARWYSVLIGQGWSDQREADAERAASLAAHAIGLDGQNALALTTYGHVRSFLFHDCDTAMIYFDRAIAACPNLALAWILSSGALSYMGRSAEAVHRAEHALRLSPSDRSMFSAYLTLGIAHYAHGSYEEALRWARMSVSESPTYTANLRILAAALSALGRIDEAHEIGVRMLKQEADFRLGEYARTRQPFCEPKLRDLFLSHLRKAGLPE